MGGFSVGMRAEQTHHPTQEAQWGNISETQAKMRLGDRAINLNRFSPMGLSALGLNWETRGHPRHAGFDETHKKEKS